MKIQTLPRLQNARVAELFVIELPQIYLMNSNVSILENHNQVLNHSTLIRSTISRIYGQGLLGYMSSPGFSEAYRENPPTVGLMTTLSPQLFLEKYKVKKRLKILFLSWQSKPNLDTHVF